MWRPDVSISAEGTVWSVITTFFSLNAKLWLTYFLSKWRMHSGFHCIVNMQEVWFIFICMVDVIMVSLFSYQQDLNLCFKERETMNQQKFNFSCSILYFIFYSHFMDVENNELKWKNALLLLMVYRYSYGLKNLLVS